MQHPATSRAAKCQSLRFLAKSIPASSYEPMTAREEMMYRVLMGLVEVVCEQEEEKAKVANDGK